MLDCKKIDSLMIDWLYDELDDTTAASFDEHVSDCAHCERELASLQRTREAVKQLPAEDPPLAVSNILLHEAAKRAPARKAGLDERPGLVARIAAWFGPALRHPGLAAVACLVLVAGVAGSLYMQGKGGYTPPTAKSDQPPPESERPSAAASMPDDRMDNALAEHRPTADQPSADPADKDKEADDAKKAESFKSPDKDLGVVARGPKADEKQALAKVRKQLAQKSKRPEPRKPARRRLSRRKGKPTPTPLADMEPTAPKGEGRRVESKNARTRYRNMPKPRPSTNVVTGADKLITKKTTKWRGRAAANKPSVKAPPPPPAPGATRGFDVSKKRKPKKSVRPAYQVYKVSPRIQVWTETQHQKLNAAVARKNCRSAAKLAADILDRNPNYYYKQVGPTKQIKQCRWYVNREWNRRAKSRARRAKPRMKRKSGGIPAKAKTAPEPDLVE